MSTERARTILTALRDRHARRGEAFELARTSVDLVWLECLRGDLPGAETAAGEAVERLLQLDAPDARAHALAVRAHVDAHAGRVDLARSRAREVIALLGASARRARATLVFVELSVGDHAAAAEHARAVDLAGGDAAEAVLGVGMVDEAAALAVGHDAPRAQGLILAARDDLDAAARALEEACADQERQGMSVEQARSLLALGRVRRRQRRRAAAREAIDAAFECFHTAGAPRWAEQAEAERAELELAPVAEGLTPTQERVARLAASGLTNREVADSLVVSAKTVEAHLARAYRKLGIRSRAELGARMALEAA
jgi:DNA-binding NarL/FixJ family response regulator